MSSTSGVLYDEADSGVGAGIVYVPFGVEGVGGVSGFGKEEDWGVVVCTEGGIVHGPEEVAGCIDFGANFDGDGCRGGRGGGDGVERFGVC